MDKSAINEIEKLNTETFLEKADKTTICGAGGIAVCIEICKLLGAGEGKLIEYYTSGDVMGDFDNAVGYAGMVIV